MPNTVVFSVLAFYRFLFSSRVSSPFPTRTVFSILSMNLDRMMGILFDGGGLLLPSRQGQIQANFLTENRVCELPYPCPDK